MPIPRFNQSILVVDDEPELVILLGAFLKKHGYQVRTTTSSVEALQTFLEIPDQISLLLTDLTMPQLSGTELARRVKAVRPAVPVILCTGFGEEVGWQRAEALQLSACLGKPVGRLDLIQAVRKALNQTREPA